MMSLESHQDIVAGMLRPLKSPPDAMASNYKRELKDDPNYPMRTGRNVCLIFNTTKFECLPSKPSPLLDNMKEVQSLKEAFESLRFACFVHQNLRAKEIIQRAYDVSRNGGLEEVDCLVCWIIAYANKSQLYARDTTMDLDSLIDVFRPERCRDLVGKPKLFFIQAMNDEPRRVYWETDARRVTGEEEEEYTYKYPLPDDFFFAFSSAPGYLDHGDEKELMLFTRTTTDIIRDHGMKRMDLLTLMEMVADSVNRVLTERNKDIFWTYQIPCSMSTLTRRVLLSKKPLKKR